MIGKILRKFNRYWWPLQKLPKDLRRRFSLGELMALKLDRTMQYAYCVYYFDNFLPLSIKEHRRYFSIERRGFGEDAFHAMWYLLFQEIRPARVLEIGVYRGQTVTLWGLLGKEFDLKLQASCISPFTAAGDQVSQYSNLDYFADFVKNHRAFNLEIPKVHKLFSTDTAAKEVIENGKWDICYIDGNHDYEIALSDWNFCVAGLKPEGLIVLDDSALDTTFSPPPFATAGHPGPSRLAAAIDNSLFREIFSAGHNRVFQKL